MAVISASGRTNALQQQPSGPNTQRNRALHINSMLCLLTTPPPLARPLCARPALSLGMLWPPPERVPPNELLRRLRGAGPCVGFALAGRVDHVPQCAAAWLARGRGGPGPGAHRPSSACGTTVQQWTYSRGYFCLPAYGVVLRAAVPCPTTLPHRLFGSNGILSKKHIRPEDSGREDSTQKG
jgi:hypothetical protein